VKAKEESERPREDIRGERGVIRATVTELCLIYPIAASPTSSPVIILVPPPLLPSPGGHGDRAAIAAAIIERARGSEAGEWLKKNRERKDNEAQSLDDRCPLFRFRGPSTASLDFRPRLRRASVEDLYGRQEKIVAPWMRIFNLR